MFTKEMIVRVVADFSILVRFGPTFVLASTSSGPPWRLYDDERHGCVLLYSRTWSLTCEVTEIVELKAELADAESPRAPRMALVSRELICLRFLKVVASPSVSLRDNTHIRSSW